MALGAGLRVLPHDGGATDSRAPVRPGTPAHRSEARSVLAIRFGERLGMPD